MHPFDTIVNLCFSRRKFDGQIILPAKQKGEAVGCSAASPFIKYASSYLVEVPPDGLAMASRIEVSASIFFMR